MKKNLVVFVIIWVLKVNATFLSPVLLNKINGRKIVDSVFRFVNQTDKRIWRNLGAATIENIRGLNCTPKYPNQDRAFLIKNEEGIAFGVFDGHGNYGDFVSSFVRDKYFVKIQEILLQKNKQLNYLNFITQFNEELQKTLSTMIEARASGTTSVCGLIKDKKLFVANTGDSRLVVVNRGGVRFATTDHKPTNSSELQRIKESGGHVSRGYVFAKNSSSGLALSRSLGDCLNHSNNAVTAVPELNVIDLKEKDIIVAASDGLFDVMSNQELAMFLDRIEIRNIAPQDQAQELADQARQDRSNDDITIIVAHFNEFKDYNF